MKLNNYILLKRERENYLTYLLPVPTLFMDGIICMGSTKP